MDFKVSDVVFTRYSKRKRCSANLVPTWIQHPSASPPGYSTRISSTRHGGQLPSNREVLLSFKGIGDYTAGAILSFAFGKREPILDTNVARVLFRVFVNRGNPRSHAMHKHLWNISRVLLPIKNVFDFNQALMDLGAIVCIARKPHCSVCPMKKICLAFPYKPKNKHEETT